MQGVKTRPQNFELSKFWEKLRKFEYRTTVFLIILIKLYFFIECIKKILLCHRTHINQIYSI